MKTYWNNKHKRAEIIEDIEKDNAKPWDTWQVNPEILIGNDRIFIHPTDYHIDGYSLTTKDLESILEKLKENKQ